MSATIIDCVNALREAVQSVPALQNKVVFAYNEMDFSDKIKGLISYPGAAIIYEGMHSLPEMGATARVGISAQVVLGVILIDQGETINRSDQKKINALDYLDQIRGKIMGTRSPTGHFWHFLVEAPAELSHGMVFWVQRWSVPIQLNPR